MRILLIHPDFPGSFRHLASSLGAMPDTTVLFLAERHRREIHIPGVRRLLVASPPNADDHDRAEREIIFALRRGANMANALLRLQSNGFTPDIVCSSSGSGSNFYLKDIFPKTFHAVYADWFYTKATNYSFFSNGMLSSGICSNDVKPSPADFAPARVRNLSQFNSLAECDLAVASTKWQRAQFPACLANSIRVLHQGVDTDFFSPYPDKSKAGGLSIEGCNLTHAPELVTFSGRGLEPFRGFPQFAGSLSRILAARPACHVLIMASASSKSVREPAGLPHALAFLSAEEQTRVHFLGFRPYQEYRALLRASTVHVYLTAPFALSSGLFEAMSCGCLLAGSDTAPVQEVIRHGENGFLCDFRNTASIAETIIGLLERSHLMQPVREAARQTILERYALKTLAPLHLKLLLESYKEKCNAYAHS